MTDKKIISVSESCFKTGRTFSYEANRLSALGVISPNDPRVKYSTKAGRLKVSSSDHDILNLWSNIGRENLPPSVLAPMKVGDGVIKSFSRDTRSSNKLSFCLETAAVNASLCGGNSSVFIEAAAAVTDAAILKDRHKDYQGSVSSLSEKTGLPPQRILAGLVRTDCILPTDHRITSFTDGYLEEINSYDRTEFYNQLGKATRSGLNDLGPQGTGIDAKDLGRLNAISQADGLGRSNREIQTLHASAALVEQLSGYYAQTDPERAKHLAGLSMSASSRAILISQSSLKIERPDTRIVE